jgi:hypothetical protein
MNDIVAENRAAPEAQRAMPHSLWTGDSARPQSGEGHAARPRNWGQIGWSNRMLSERNKGNQELKIPASAADHLRRIILQRLDLANDAQMCATETPWASITFTGARHLFTLTVDDYEIAKRMLETLDEDEFDIPDHLVADVAVTVTEIDSRRAIQLEILTVESG